MEPQVLNGILVDGKLSHASSLKLNKKVLFYAAKYMNLLKVLQQLVAGFNLIIWTHY